MKSQDFTTWNKGNYKANWTMINHIKSNSFSYQKKKKKKKKKKNEENPLQ